MLSRLYEQYISENVPMMDIGAHGRMMWPNVAGNENNMTRERAPGSVKTSRLDRFADVWSIVVHHVDAHPAGTSARKVGKSFLTASTTSMVLVRAADRLQVMPR